MVGANWGVSGHDVVLGLVGAPSLFDNPHASMFRGRSEVSGEAGRVVTCRSTEHTQSLCRERKSQLSAAGGRCAGEKGQGPTGGMSDQATPSPFPHQQIARPQPRNPHKTHCFTRLIWQTNSDTVLRHTIATIAFRPSALAFQHTRAHTKLPTNSRVPSPAALQ